jgi:hypothetical protein
MHLRPGQPDDAVYFSLKIFTLSRGLTLPDSEALSYTWGDATQPQ